MLRLMYIYPSYNITTGSYFLTQLAHSEQEKDFGILVPADLKPSSAQVAKAASSANSLLGRLRSTFTCLNERIFPPLYKALIRPRIEFAIQAWSPSSKERHPEARKGAKKSDKAGSLTTKFTIWKPTDCSWSDNVRAAKNTRSQTSNFQDPERVE